jgi:hypothetical protein
MSTNAVLNSIFLAYTNSQENLTMASPGLMVNINI